MTWLAVVLGGAVGTAARHGVNMATTRLYGGSASYATATVNMVGAFLVGLLAGAVASGRLTLAGPTRAFLFVGILGGFTTFSAYMLDTLTLLDGGAVGRALFNLLGQVALGLALVYGGYRFGQGLWTGA